MLPCSECIIRSYSMDDIKLLKLTHVLQGRPWDAVPIQAEALGPLPILCGLVGALTPMSSLLQVVKLPPVRMIGES